ncbi:hypothetical protein cypCar_00006297 [Cyprinus carpio]|nr:hypothetical protein cypCar_00006297 [Cyprinus carpio]
MSEDSESKPYLFSSLEGQNEAAGCSSMSTLHRMGSFAEGTKLGMASEGSDSSQDTSASPHNKRKMAHSLHEDVEMKSSGSSGSGTESHGNESHGNDSHGNESHGNESSGSSNSRSKDSALIESSGSNKRCREQSLALVSH